MQNLAPVTAPVRRSRKLRLAFLAAVVALVASYIAAAAPIPLFNTYRAEDGFSNAGISLTVVIYSLGTVMALLVLGRLSNHTGRRPTAWATLGVLVVGCLLLLSVHHIGTLLAARLLIGIGVGLASSNLTAYVVDAAPSTPVWLASVAASQSPQLGLTLGAIGSGALVQFGPWPRDLVYLVAIGLLLVSAALISFSSETASPMPGVWRSLRPRVHIPIRARHLIPAAAAVFVATWSTGAFYQGLVPALVADQLGTRSPLILGLVFSAFMATSVLGAPIGGRFTPAAAQRAGMIMFLMGLVGAASATATGTLPLFIGASVVAGVGQGIAISAAIRGLLYGSMLAERAPIFATVYLINYGGAAILSLVSGELSNVFALPQIAFGYAGLAVVATVITVLAARNPHFDPGPS